MAYMPLYRSVETASLITNRVLVAFSGGKDSVVTLDLCMKNFAHVECFFMYHVKGLSFQESIIKYYEDRYGIRIHRFPHFELSNLFRYGVFRLYDETVPIIGINDCYKYIRSKTGIWWIAAGERISDSIWRRAMIKHSGTIDEKRGRFYPVAEWSKHDITSYIKQRRLRVGLESSKLGFSFRSLAGKDIFKIKQNFPKDFEKIKKWFPFIEASVMQYQMKVEKNGK